jgi:LytS/YehU family sensor histidine kinase
LLKKYLELENLRFHNAIDYKFIIPEELDLNTEIPSMIIQPFVENAIIHGLSGLNYQPKLLLIFENANNILNIYIHDNGHGIIIQKEGNTPKISNHHLSRGNEITKERMTAFSQQGTHLLTLDYIIPPFFNENGKGTSVKLSITFND